MILTRTKRAPALSPDKEVFVETGVSGAFSTPDGSHNKIRFTFKTVNGYLMHQSITDRNVY